MQMPESSPGLPSSLVEAVSWLRAGAITSVELCEAMLKRLHSQNDRIRAVRTIFEKQALGAAAEIDRGREGGIPMTPLAGIPFLVKENIDVLPGPVSAGQLFLKGRMPTHEAWIVRRLRSAGAVILGTTVSDPGAFGVRTEFVQHPMNPAFTVGGSSGGSAAALAAGYAYAALGTDTGGSIRIPSACCGVAGLKPTFGAWSTEGVYPLVRDLDHVGPMAQTVEDLAEVWNALTPALPLHAPATWPLRLGWCPEWLAQAQPDVQLEFHRSLQCLADQGHLISQVRLPELDDVAHIHFTHFCSEVCKIHLHELGHAPEMFEPEAQSAFKAGSELDSDELQKVAEMRMGLRSKVDDALAGMDFLVLPTLPVHGPELADDSFLIGGRPRSFTATLVRLTSLFNHTGHPVLSAPAPGTAPEQLHSVQWVGRWGAESLLLDAVGRVLKECS